jgi:hypothetical protein
MSKVAKFPASTMNVRFVNEVVVVDVFLNTTFLYVMQWMNRKNPCISIEDQHVVPRLELFYVIRQYMRFFCYTNAYGIPCSCVLVVFLSFKKLCSLSKLIFISRVKIKLNSRIWNRRIWNRWIWNRWICAWLRSVNRPNRDCSACHIIIISYHIDCIPYWLHICICRSHSRDIITAVNMERDLVWCHTVINEVAK